MKKARMRVFTNDNKTFDYLIKGSTPSTIGAQLFKSEFKNIGHYSIKLLTEPYFLFSGYTEKDFGFNGDWLEI